jgi:hypothetical protein
MAKKLLFPDDVLDQLRRRYERSHRMWLGSGGDWPLSVTLGDPTERDAAGHAEHVRDWIAAWSGWRGGVLRWNEVRWPRLGTQVLPVRLELESPELVATLIGQAPRFTRASARRDELVHRWPMLAGTPTIERQFDVLADYPEVEYRRLVELLSWLVEHPSSNYALRQLPIEGIDTKWIEKSRRALVAELLQAICDGPPSGDFYDICGLRRPHHRVRLMVLCRHLREVTAGLRDLETPLPELQRLPLAPLRVLIVENLESGLSLPDIPGTVAIVKLGASVGVLGSVPWLRGLASLYWGDIDTYGLAILNHARAALGNVESILMDEPTLLAHRSLWGCESRPYPEAELASLTAPELALLNDLRSNRWGQGVRLEQERIPWNHAVDALLRACNDTEPLTVP